MKYYKFLNARGKPIYGTGMWSLPKNGKPGEWMPLIEEIKMCYRGYHVSTVDWLIDWLGQVLWEVEVKGKHKINQNKMVFQQARLLRKVDAWNARTARLLSADFAEHVLHMFEKLYPGDDRPRKAIIAARKYAYGKLTTSNLSAAWSAARSAAWRAEQSAARSAVWSAEQGAVWSAEQGAAWSTAWRAAESAEWSAVENAAWRAARSAARSAVWSAEQGAAWSAAWSAAESAEREWQSNRLIKYLRL